MTLLDETYVPFMSTADRLERGLECCRKGDWKTGFEHLSVLAQQDHKTGSLPSRFYSYLGYGMALHEGRISQGIKLCRYAVKLEFFQPENYVNLAQVYLLANRRDKASKAVLKGLEVDPEHPALVALHKTLGERKPPALPFLSRSNILNQVLGRLRHALRRAPAKSETSQEPTR